MHTAKKFVLLGGALVAATSVLAADVNTTTQPLTGQLLLKRGQATTGTRMEYCLRNMPELTDSLVAAHSNYSRAAAEAAAIVDRDYPASSFTFQRVRVLVPPQSAEEDLKMARSEGFNLLCPNLIVYMQRATGKTLAKEIGDMLLNAQKLSEP
jgi:hypothetical protein